MSLRKIEQDIVKGILLAASILLVYAIIQFTIAFLTAYRTGEVTSFVGWFSNWLADNIVFAVYVLVIVAFMGLISPKIARALRDMSGF